MAELLHKGERIFRGIPVSVGVSRGKILVLGRTQHTICEARASGRGTAGGSQPSGAGAGADAARHSGCAAQGGRSHGSGGGQHFRRAFAGAGRPDIDRRGGSCHQRGESQRGVCVPPGRRAVCHDARRHRGRLLAGARGRHARCHGPGIKQSAGAECRGGRAQPEGAVHHHQP